MTPAQLVGNETLYTWVLDPLERGFKTGVETFLVISLGTGLANVAHPHVAYLDALIPAGLSAAASVLLTYLTILVGLHDLKGYVDLVVRVIKTFLTTYLGIVAAGGVTTYVVSTWANAFGPALGTAAIALIWSGGTVNNPATKGGSMIKVMQLLPNDGSAVNAPEVMLATPLGRQKAGSYSEPFRDTLHSGLGAADFAVNPPPTFATGQSAVRSEDKTVGGGLVAVPAVEPTVVHDVPAAQAAPVKAPVARKAATRAPVKKAATTEPAPVKKAVTKSVVTPAKKVAAKKPPPRK